MLCWLITICTICTIARLWIVISWFVWEMRTRESDRDRLSCENCIVHSWFVWMLWTREEPSLTDSAGIRDSRMRTRDGGRSWVWTTQWTIHCYRKHDWTNERTNNSFWRTERRELIRANESWNPSLGGNAENSNESWTIDKKVFTLEGGVKVGVSIKG